MLSLLLALAIEVLPGNNMPLVEASVNGESCTLLLDTGASHTTLDLNFVTNRLAGVELKEIELVGRTNVASLPKFAAVTNLTLGASSFDIEGLMALDLSHLSAGVGKRVDGILGMNHLRLKPCLVSLKRGELIWDPTQEDATGFRPVMTRDRGTTFELIAKLPTGEIMPLLIDTGSSFTFIDQRFWQASGADIHFGTTDVNSSASMGFVRGEKGEINCGKGLKLAIEPVLTEETARNQLGSDLFREVDILITPSNIFLRN